MRIRLKTRELWLLWPNRQWLYIQWVRSRKLPFVAIVQRREMPDVSRLGFVTWLRWHATLDEIKAILER